MEIRFDWVLRPTLCHYCHKNIADQAVFGRLSRKGSRVRRLYWHINCFVEVGLNYLKDHPRYEVAGKGAVRKAASPEVTALKLKANTLRFKIRHYPDYHPNREWILAKWQQEYDEIYRQIFQLQQAELEQSILQDMPLVQLTTDIVVEQVLADSQPADLLLDAVSKDLPLVDDGDQQGHQLAPV